MSGNKQINQYKYHQKNGFKMFSFITHVKKNPRDNYTPSYRCCPKVGTCVDGGDDVDCDQRYGPCTTTIFPRGKTTNMHPIDGLRTSLGPKCDHKRLYTGNTRVCEAGHRTKQQNNYNENKKNGKVNGSYSEYLKRKYGNYKSEASISSTSKRVLCAKAVNGIQYNVNC